MGPAWVPALGFLAGRACVGGIDVDVGPGAAAGALPVAFGAGELWVWLDCGTVVGLVDPWVRPALAAGWLATETLVEVADTVEGCVTAGTVALLVTGAGVVVNVDGPGRGPGTFAGSRLVGGPPAGLGTCTPTTARASAATSWAGPGRASAAASPLVSVTAATTPAVATFSRAWVPVRRAAAGR